VRVGERPALDIWWLNPGLRREAPKKRRAPLRSPMLREVKCTALRYCSC